MKVSVIIPSFNCAPYLPEAVSSVLQQTHRDLETIVVDDGSSDNTEKAVEPFLDRIQYIKQENKGVSAARNTGIMRATGDLIAFLDADDTWSPEKISVQLNILDKHPDVAGVFSDFALCDKDGKVTHERFAARNYHVFNYYKCTWENIFPQHYTAISTKSGDSNCMVYHGDIFRSLYIGNFINTSSVILRREVMDTVGYFTPERRTQEDYEYWLKIADGYPMAYVDKPLLCTRRRPNQLTSNSEMFDIVHQSLDVIENIGLNNINRLGKDIVIQRLTDKYRKLAIINISRGNSRDARGCVLKCIKWKPTSPKDLLLFVMTYIPATIINATYKALKSAERR